MKKNILVFKTKEVVPLYFLCKEIKCSLIAGSIHCPDSEQFVTFPLTVEGVCDQAKQWVLRL